MRTSLPTPHSRPLPYGALVGIVAVLYFAKEVLIPLALAILFSFLLGPVVRRLERSGLWRIPSVLTVTAAFFGIFAGIGWITAHQIVELAGKLPSYQDNIQHKLQDWRGQGGAIKTAATVLANIEKKSEAPAASPEDGKSAVPSLLARQLSADPERPPLPVRIIEPPATAPQFLRDMFGTLLTPVGTAFVVVIFTIFMLIQREDLRDRLLHLTGPERLPITTQAVDEAGQRVSRYLLMQVTVNVTFGAGITLGLFFIGVPAPVLWGILSACLRFVPYVGVWISAAGPLAVAMGAFASSWPVAETLGLFVALELVTGNAVEPWLYGTSTGLSPVAIIVAATFWTWLWGSVGLLLSTPLTVCIVVLGRYVPQLEFLHTLLGDEPVLPQDARLYQRLLASDQEEISLLVDEYLAGHPVAEFYDSVLIPTLNQAQTDAQQGSLDADRQDFILQTTHTLLDELRERPSAELIPKAAVEAAAETSETRVSQATPVTTVPLARAEDFPLRVLILPVKNAADELAGDMLAHLLTLGGVGSKVLSSKALVNEALDAFANCDADIVCLSLVRPFAVMQARYLAKRLRTRYPRLKILIGLWDSKRPAVGSRRNLQTVHADWVVESLGDAISQVCPIVHCLPNPALEATPEDAVRAAQPKPAAAEAAL